MEVRLLCGGLEGGDRGGVRATRVKRTREDAMRRLERGGN